MDPRFQIALFSILTLILSGLLTYLIVVAWKQDVDAARRILLATTVVTGIAALTSLGFTVQKAVTYAKNKEEEQLFRSFQQTGQ